MRERGNVAKSLFLINPFLEVLSLSYSFTLSLSLSLYFSLKISISVSAITSPTSGVIEIMVPFSAQDLAYWSVSYIR